MSTETFDQVLNFEDSQQSEADKKLAVLFFTSPVKNEPKSIEAGRPIFDEIDMVKIITPGSRDNFVGDATPDYQQRFPTQWGRYKAGKVQLDSGSPLSVLPWMGVAQIAEFEAVGCRTVEQLVGMADALSQKFMGHHQIKARAQQYLDAAKETAPLLKMQAELTKRDDEMATLKAQLQAQGAALADMQAKAAVNVARKG